MRAFHPARRFVLLIVCAAVAAGIYVVLNRSYLAPFGTPLGQVVDVIETGSADVVVVRGPRGEVLLPLLGEVFQTLDPAAGEAVVTPLPGLLDDAH